MYELSQLPQEVWQAFLAKHSTVQIMDNGTPVVWVPMPGEPTRQIPIKQLTQCAQVKGIDLATFVAGMADKAELVKPFEWDTFATQALLAAAKEIFQKEIKVGHFYFDLKDYSKAINLRTYGYNPYTWVCDKDNFAVTVFEYMDGFTDPKNNGWYIRDRYNQTGSWRLLQQQTPSAILEYLRSGIVRILLEDIRAKGHIS